MSLQKYRRKRHFAATPEPPGAELRPRGGEHGAEAPRRLRYVIHKHRARTLHYDFRLQWKGVLLSWAVPKGPSTDPGTRRLAVRVEDHPLDYAKFEGRIPEGEYGAGTVVIWDEGVWRPDDPNVDAALRRGELRFTLEGRRLKGAWVLVRTGLGVAGRPRQAWLLIKRRETVEPSAVRSAAATTRRARRPSSASAPRTRRRLRRSAAPSGSA
jgi:bifunctional non-homologous end joining protein LigD